ncbi:AGAP010932-PA-like protein [Anopheles sinensis]|uniref:AGAP010932-PA-like protein n=1 Tax=Anopheles sinensis TaxID=74873 RepID=A0A084VSJ0_ANOSI|nr:AGAP010932-PA-like protein [Anopheles sinensis]
MGSSSSESEEERKHKKHKKKEKKSKKSKKEKKSKKDKKHKHRKRDRSSSVSSGSEADEWLEAAPVDINAKPEMRQSPAKLERDDWMNSMLIPTYSKEPKKEEKKTATNDPYDPKTSVRELNPHWKNGGSGLPSFRKPVMDDDDNAAREAYGSRQAITNRSQSRSANSGGWKKSAKDESHTRRDEKSDLEKTLSIVDQSKPAGNEAKTDQLLTDEQLNELGAKIVKAELLGNTVQATALKEKLETAKALRNEMQSKTKSEQGQEVAPKRRLSTEESVTYTVSKSYDGSQRNHGKKQKQYQQNLPLGPALQDKFRSERHENDSMDAQFFKVSAKMGEGKRLENIFDHERASSAVGEASATEERTVREMNRMSKAQTDCERCINSGRFSQDQLITMGKNVYLSIPTWRALQPKHCFIVPVGHYPSLTQVDEDVHQEIVDVCKALVQMFRKHQMEVVFFETVRYLNRNPHMYIQCVPAKDYEMAPFYFKKAILESETEWAMNKKLHNVDGFNVKRTVPKNLPYFWVNFNMENGFAHVIEDQESFPVTFATETIAGILGLDTRDWRKPRKEMNPAQKVDEFKNWWREFETVLRND